MRQRIQVLERMVEQLRLTGGKTFLTAKDIEKQREALLNYDFLEKDKK